MGIPGANLFKLASSLISLSDAKLVKWNSRTLNNRGLWVSNYDASIDIRVSPQPVPRSVYKQLGLDFSKDAWHFYSDVNLQDLARDTASDHILFDDKRFEIVTQKDWFVVDGWTNVIAYSVPENIPSTPT